MFSISLWTTVIPWRLDWETMIMQNLACARLSDSIVGTYENEQSENKTRTTWERGRWRRDSPRTFFAFSFFWTTFHHYLGAWNRLCKLLHYGQCESCELPSHREKPVSIPYVSVQCGFVMKGQCLFVITRSIISVFRTLLSAPPALAFFAAPFSHELKAPVWSLRCAIFTRCLSCPR